MTSYSLSFRTHLHTCTLSPYTALPNTQLSVSRITLVRANVWSKYSGAVDLPNGRWPKLTPTRMCIQNYRTYTCGCKRTEQFKQCEPLLGTNVKCSRLRWEPLGPSAHMCLQHMVKPGNKILRLKEGSDSENSSGQIDDRNSSANC